MALRTLKSLKKKESDLRKKLNLFEEEKASLSLAWETWKPMKKEGMFKEEYLIGYARLTLLTYVAFDIFYLMLFEDLLRDIPQNMWTFIKKHANYSESKFTQLIEKWCRFLNKKYWDTYKVNFNIDMEEKRLFLSSKKVKDGLGKFISESNDEGSVLKAGTQFIADANYIGDTLDIKVENFSESFSESTVVFINELPTEERYKELIQKMKKDPVQEEIAEYLMERIKERLNKLEEKLPALIERYDKKIEDTEKELQTVLKEKEKRKRFDEKKETEKEKRVEELKDEANELVSTLRELGIEPKHEEKEISNEDAEGELKHITSALNNQIRKLKSRRTKIIQLRKRTEELLRKLHASNIYQFDYELNGLLDLIPGGRDPKEVKKSVLNFIEKELIAKKTEMKRLLMKKEKLEDQAEKDIILCNKYKGKFNLVSDCKKRVENILFKLNDDSEWKLNKQTLKSIENELEEISNKLSKMGDILRRGERLPQKVNNSSKKRVLAEHIKNLDISDKVKNLLKKEKFDEIDALFNYTFLLVENSSEIERKKLEKYFSLLEKGKYRSLKKRLSKLKKKKGPDRISELKEQLGKKTFSNEIILERMRTLFWVLGENDLEQGKQEAEWLAQGLTWKRPTTHQTKHVYPSLRDLGINIRSHSTSGEIKIKLTSKQRKKLEIWINLYGLIKEKE